MKDACAYTGEHVGMEISEGVWKEVQLQLKGETNLTENAITFCNSIEDSGCKRPKKIKNHDSDYQRLPDVVYACKRECAWAISNATNHATPQQIQYLLSRGIFPVMCNNLLLKKGNFIETGSGTTVCELNSEWNNVPSCTADPCTPSGNVANSNKLIAESIDGTTGQSVTITCNAVLETGATVQHSVAVHPSV